MIVLKSVCHFYYRKALIAGAVELRNEIARVSQVSLPGTLVFDYPTISAIATFLFSKQPKEILLLNENTQQDIQRPPM